MQMIKKIITGTRADSGRGREELMHERQVNERSEIHEEPILCYFVSAPKSHSFHFIFWLILSLPLFFSCFFSFSFSLLCHQEICDPAGKLFWSFEAGHYNTRGLENEWVEEHQRETQTTPTPTCRHKETFFFHLFPCLPRGKRKLNSLLPNDVTFFDTIQILWLNSPTYKWRVCVKHWRGPHDKVYTVSSGKSNSRNICSIQLLNFPFCNLTKE